MLKYNQIGFSKAVVSNEAHHGFVTADLHDGQHMDSRAAEIGNSGMVEVMEAKVFNPSILTSGLEGPFDRTDCRKRGRTSR